MYIHWLTVVHSHLFHINISRLQSSLKTKKNIYNIMYYVVFFTFEARLIGLLYNKKKRRIVQESSIRYFLTFINAQANCFCVYMTLP